MRLIVPIIFSLFSFLFTACGGGGGGSSSSTLPAASTVTGQFVDDTVQNLNYTCTSGSAGTTNANGEYTCNIGDDVTLSIGTVAIGTIAAQSTMITPYSLFPNDIEAALNLARLIQSLDSDGNTSNGVIVIDSTLAASVPADVNFSSATFTDDIQNVSAITLVDGAIALQQMNDEIVAAGGTIPDGGHIPVADAGSDQNTSTSTLVTLDGNISSDADGDNLYYSWSIVSYPTGSTATLSDPNAVNPTFTPDVNGTYVFELVVNDGLVDSASDTITLVSITGNSAPVADAGDSQSVHTGVLVTLDASDSTDADVGDTLSYSWNFTSVPGGSSITNSSLSSTTTVNPTFTPDIDGSYVLSLIVNDGTVNSGADTVSIDAGRFAALSGTINDADTNLMWQDNLNTTSTKFFTASTYCADLELASYKDWYLPVKNELSTIVDTNNNPTIYSDFSYVQANKYMTASYQNTGDGNIVWIIDFLNGNESYIDIYYESSYNVRCVRPTNSRFSRDEVNNIVSDSNTMLMWQDDTAAKTNLDNYTNAATYCSNSALAGYNDWRLPTKTELIGLTNTSYYPIIEGAFQNIRIDEYYWTSTSEAGLIVGVIFPNVKAYDNASNINSSGLLRYRCVRTSHYTHNSITYGTVVSPNTGKIWLDKNLGANQVCTAYDDSACYGDYFQWGRPADGHEKTSSTAYNTTKADSLNPGHSDFIYIASVGSPMYDWTTIDSDGALRSIEWGKTDGTSICPVGFRVPTFSELNAETLSATVPIANRTDAFNSFLKIPSAGTRLNASTVAGQADYGGLLTITPGNFFSDTTEMVQFTETTAINPEARRSNGYSVRCIQD